MVISLGKFIGVRELNVLFDITQIAHVSPITVCYK